MLSGTVEQAITLRKLKITRVNPTTLTHSFRNVTYTSIV